MRFAFGAFDHVTHYSAHVIGAFQATPTFPAATVIPSFAAGEHGGLVAPSTRHRDGYFARRARLLDDAELLTRPLPRSQSFVLKKKNS